MFKLDMNAIRKSASDTWLMAIPAIPAIPAIKSGENGAENSQQPQKIANIAKIAISQQLNCTLQAAPASTQSPALVQPPAPAPDKPSKQTFMENADTWLHLDRAYQAHHFACPVCIAAGRGAGYGLRCGTGAALWTTYSDATQRTTP